MHFINPSLPILKAVGGQMGGMRLQANFPAENRVYMIDGHVALGRLRGFQGNLTGVWGITFLSQRPAFLGSLWQLFN